MWLQCPFSGKAGRDRGCTLCGCMWLQYELLKRGLTEYELHLVWVYVVAICSVMVKARTSVAPRVGVCGCNKRFQGSPGRLQIAPSVRG